MIQLDAIFSQSSLLCSLSDSSGPMLVAPDIDDGTMKTIMNNFGTLCTKHRRSLQI